MLNSIARPLALACIVGASIGVSTHARELFVDGKAPEMAQGSSIEHDDLIGGYQIYKGDGFWYLNAASVSWSAGTADSIPIGIVSMSQWDDSTVVAIQQVAANLRANNGAYWSGAPCQGESLVTRIRSRGRYDDCMRIDTVSLPINNSTVTFFRIYTAQSNSGGRYYAASTLVNAQRLGFSSTTVADWTPSVVAADPNKTQVIHYLTLWAHRYQDAAAAQMDYRKTPDTFAAVPAIRDMLPSDFSAFVSPRTRTEVAQRSVSFAFCETTQTMVREGLDACPATRPASPARGTPPVQPNRSASYVYCEATGRMEEQGSANCQ